ncbi:MAG: nuclear transport factor 2 family protein [Bacteroidota bacterium]
MISRIFSFLLLLLLLLCYTPCLLGQSDEDQIRAVVNDYAVGTAYNNAEQLRSAFLPGANMFLDHPEQPLYVMKIEDYAGRVAKQEQGKFNGRVSNILSIDQTKGIAVVKLEVIIPGLEARFIDLLLLKKLDEGWKIISKTAAREAAKPQTKKVLLILSSASFQGNSDLPAGNSFAEVAIAYGVYRQAGYHVDMLSPLGGKVPIVYIDPTDSLQLAYLYNRDFMYALTHTLTPAAVNPDEYAICQYTGGSAPIFDVPQNEAIQKIVMHIYEQNQGVVAAVCHGTAGIVHLKTADGQYLVAGKTVNTIPDAQERHDLPFYQQYPFIIETLLKERGATVRYSDIREPHMEVDGRLVTGQNSVSSERVSLKTIEISQALSQ